jgi:hypothetical protein
VDESHHHPKLAQEKKPVASCQHLRTALAGREPPGQRRQHCERHSRQKLGGHRPHAAEIR